MEKKRVRIYKAQEGGQPSVDQLGYPGAVKKEQEQLTEDQVVEMIYQDIISGMPVEGIINKLVNAVGMEPTMAQDYYTSVKTSIEQQKNEETEEELLENEAVEPEAFDKEEEPEALPPLFEQQDYSELLEDDGYSQEDTAAEDEMIMNTMGVFSLGGFKSKKSYINNAVRKVKKQYGGDAEESTDDSDPTGEGLRTNNLNSFIDAVKREGNATIAKETAKEEYDNAFNQYNESLNQFIPQDFALDEAKFGGDKRMMRRMNRLLRKLPTADFPMQSIDNVNVERVGLFGRPKEYTVNFNDSPLKELAGNPMLSSMYEYGFPMQEIKIPAKVVTTEVRNLDAIIDDKTIPKKAFGGGVDAMNYTPGNPLQRFIPGGNNITQNDIDDVYSKDVTDPFMPQAQRGGGFRDFFENYFPANITPRHYQQYRGTYDASGKLVMPELGENTMIRNIHVDRQNIFGRPKEYTINFTNPEMDPRKQNLIAVPSGTTSTQTPVPPTTTPNYMQAQDDNDTGIGMRGRMAIRQGERQADRNDRRLARDPQAAPFAYGGNLNKFIPQAQNGVNTPVVYTNNPAYAGMSTASMLNAAPANPVNMAGLTGGTNLSFNPPSMSNQQTAGFTGQQPIQSQIQIAPSQTGSHQIAQTYSPPAGDYSMKFKDKTNINVKAAVAAVSDITGLINRKNDRMNELKMMDNLTADNLYASDPSLDRGDTDTNTGLYRPDEMGQMHNSRSAQYGGAMSDYNEGDEMYMTEEELDQFLENGGEVEFI